MMEIRTDWQIRNRVRANRLDMGSSSMCELPCYAFDEPQDIRYWTEGESAISATFKLHLQKIGRGELRPC